MNKRVQLVMHERMSDKRVRASTEERRVEAWRALRGRGRVLVRRKNKKIIDLTLFNRFLRLNWDLEMFTNSANFFTTYYMPK